MTDLGVLRILVVDRHRAHADAVAVSLRSIPSLTTTVAAALDQATDFLDSARFDLVVIGDVAQPDGLDLLTHARSVAPPVPTLVFSERDDAASAVDALQHGARAIVGRASGGEELASAVAAVLRGEMWVSPALLTTVLQELLLAPTTSGHRAPALPMLTPREREILVQLVSGLDREAIGRTLFLSKNTVRTHIRNILSKLGAHSALEAVSMARAAGLRPPRSR